MDASQGVAPAIGITLFKGHLPHQHVRWLQIIIRHLDGEHAVQL